MNQNDQARTAAQPDDASADKPTDDPAALAAALEEARATADDNWARYLRTAAELENVRKRAARDLEQAHKYAVDKFAAEMLDIRDSLEMGLKAATDNGADEAHAEGTRLTLRMLEQALGKFGVEQVDPAGEAFDPQWHEAMATLPTADVAPDHVLEVVQKGYRIHDRVLRPARVIVARAPDAGQ